MDGRGKDDKESLPSQSGLDFMMPWHYSNRAVRLLKTSGLFTQNERSYLLRGPLVLSFYF